MMIGSSARWNRKFTVERDKFFEYLFIKIEELCYHWLRFVCVYVSSSRLHESEISSFFLLLLLLLLMMLPRDKKRRCIFVQMSSKKHQLLLLALDSEEVTSK